VTRPFVLIGGTRSDAESAALAEAAARAGGRAVMFDENPLPDADFPEDVAFCGGVDAAFPTAERLGVHLLGPTNDLLCRVPERHRLRAVRVGDRAEARRLSEPALVKPADTMSKAFDAAVCLDGRDVRTRRSLPDEMPVLFSEVVEFECEWRAFVCDRRVAAPAPYVRENRLLRWSDGRFAGPIASEADDARACCERLPADEAVALPPAFVADVGRIPGRGWAVVEFNPAWCSRLYSADSDGALAAVRRSCVRPDRMGPGDADWVLTCPRHLLPAALDPRSQP
jgi:hypothetical protein